MDLWKRIEFWGCIPNKAVEVRDISILEHPVVFVYSFGGPFTILIGGDPFQLVQTFAEKRDLENRTGNDSKPALAMTAGKGQPTGGVQCDAATTYHS